MSIGYVAQQPNERIKYSVDFSRWLETGETCQSGTAFSALESGASGTLQASTVYIGSDAKSVYLFISGGLDGDVYKVTVSVTTSIGQILEADFIVEVREI